MCVVAVSFQLFVGDYITRGRKLPSEPGRNEEAGGTQADEGISGFEQHDLALLIRLVCPDFPQEITQWVRHDLFGVVMTNAPCRPLMDFTYTSAPTDNGYNIGKYP